MALDVYLYDRKAASLDRQGRDGYRLRYDEGYLNWSRAVPLSTSLPLQLAAHTGAELFRVLDGYLPDRAEVREQWARKEGLADTEVYGLLAAFGEDIGGAAVFVPSGRSSTERRQLTPLSEHDVADRVRAVRQDARAWARDTQDHRFSLAGAQGKFALALAGDAWHEPQGAEPSTHIFKPGIENYPDSDVVEHVVMRLAERLDLPVAATSILEFDGERILAVERFDRLRTDAGVTRIHQEDFAQATGTPTFRKYESDGGPGVIELADVIRREFNSDAIRPALLTLGTSLVLSWLVAHNDGHSKNYSLRLLPGRTELAPLYDLNSYLPYLPGRNRLRAKDPDFAHEVKLAVAISGTYTTGDITAGHWSRLERTLELPEGTLIAYGIMIADQVMSTVNQVIDTLPPRHQPDVLEDLRVALYLRKESVLRVLTASA